jgi:hypothetical protein
MSSASGHPSPDDEAAAPAPSDPPPEEPSKEERETLARALEAEVEEFAILASGLFVRWPAFIVAVIGMAVLSLGFWGIWVSDVRLSSAEYIATLVTGAALIALGVALEVNRSRRIGDVTSAAIEAASTPEAKMDQMRDLGRDQR